MNDSHKVRTNVTLPDHAMTDHSSSDNSSHSRSSSQSPVLWFGAVAAGAAIALLIYHSLTDQNTADHHTVPAYWGIGILPFVAILLAIAILPLIRRTHTWWMSNVNRLGVSLICVGFMLIYALTIGGLGSHDVVVLLEHGVVGEYIPFIVLLIALYVISGGINLSGDLTARPLTNTMFLAVGAGIASFIGTTGASMLLIRPLLQTNSTRKHVVHTVVFFIFLVSNIGGCLLPIGDPPLFLGFLRGVPFTWTLILWQEWAFCCVVLLILYFIWDSILYKREAPADIRQDESIRRPLRMTGLINVVWMAGVVLSVWHLVPGKTIPGTSFTVFPFMREIVMLILSALSLMTTQRTIRKKNNFNYEAIAEVAALFIGIFITMQIPILVLEAKGGALGLVEPWHYFWTTGSLSSFLDNAPTYVVFFETANSMTLEAGAGTMTLDSGHHIRIDFLIAISLGAVFMGANTYIGNGPNFLVKSIAEQSGIKMPSFFGFMFRYSLPILIPLFLIVTVIFLL